MKILYLTNHLNVGGITSYCLSLTKSMEAKGHEVFVASSGGLLTQEFRKNGATFIPVPIATKQEISPSVLRACFSLKKKAGEFKIDIVHTNSRTTQVVGCFLKKYAGIAHVSTCHGFFRPRFFRRIFPCWGDRTIAISKEVREHLIKDFGLSEERIALIPHGIDADRFIQPAPDTGHRTREDLGLKNGPVVGIVARLSGVKGHEYLIRAMKEVVSKVPQAQLLIVGEGGMEGNLKNLAADLGVKDNVIFLPSAGDTARVLSVVDVFVLPSLKEGLGLALMEAMAAGLAVIGSDIGGIRTLIKHGKNGLLVKVADPGSIAAAALELINDEEKRNKFGFAARQFIKENFSLEKMAVDTERLYFECLKTRN